MRDSTSTGRGPVEGPQGPSSACPQLKTTTYVEAQLISVRYGTPNMAARKSMPVARHSGLK